MKRILFTTTARRAAACALLALAPGAGAGESVHTTDGREIAGKLVALNATQAVLETRDGQRTAPLAEIARISFAGAPAGNLLAKPGQHIVRANDGSCLGVSELTIRGGKLQAASPTTGTLSLPLEGVARVLRPAPNETPAQLEQEARQLGLAAGVDDTLGVRTPAGKWVVLNGALRSLAQGQIAFAYEGTDSTMKDDTIAIIILAAAKQAGLPPPAGQVTAIDGSRLAFKSLLLDAQGVVLESPSLGALRLRPGALAEIRFARGEGVFLSDLAPAEVRQTAFFDDEFPWQKDRSVSGRTLTLDGATFEKGLGVHAQCRLVFTLQGRFRRLSALAGIDGEARSGKARLTVLGDDKPLVERLLLDRSQQARKLDLDVRGIQTLVLAVDFAEDTFGSGARVNLCDAVLAK
jgi:hypothetical protein